MTFFVRYLLFVCELDLGTHFFFKNLFLFIFFPFLLFYYFIFNFIFKLYIIVLVLPNIKMNPSQVYIFLIGGILLYNIVLMSTTHQHESAISKHMSPPSWISPSPPTHSHASRFLQRMVEWHHWLNGQGFGWTLGVGDRQGGLVCCGSWSCKELDTTEWLNWTDMCICAYTCMYVCVCVVCFLPALIFFMVVLAKWL